MKKYLSLTLMFVLVINLISFDFVKSFEEPISFNNPVSFGWTETMTVTVTVSEDLQKAKPNVVCITFNKLDEAYGSNVELSLVNGVKPFDNYNVANEAKLDDLYTSIAYLDHLGEEIFFTYKVPYNGEKTLELTLNADGSTTNYIDYALYVGFYQYEEITQENYNSGSTNNREVLYARENGYSRIVEVEVAGTAVQIAPVDIGYQLPNTGVGFDSRLERLDYPYLNNFRLYSNNQSHLFAKEIFAFIEGKIGYESYEMGHDFSPDYRYKGMGEQRDFLEMLALSAVSFKDSNNASLQLLEPLSKDTAEAFGAVSAYKTTATLHSSTPKETDYFNSANVYTKFSYLDDSLQYVETIIYIMPNASTHTFYYKKQVHFPGNSVQVNTMISTAKAEFEHFRKTFAFVPKNNGMTPEEYGEFIKGDNTLSISLVSNSLSVLNTGVYNTGTKSDSAFLAAVRINKPYDYDAPLKLVAEVLSDDLNPPIAIMEGDELLILKKPVSSDLETFNFITRGVNGGENAGKFYHPKQKVKFALRDSDDALVALPAILEVDLADAAPVVTLVKEPKMAAQSGSDQAFVIKVTDPDNDIVDLRVSTVFGKTRAANQAFSKKFEVSVNTEEEITIGFEAPEIGNFNLNKEMQELSMVALQEGTFNTLMADLEGVYLSEHVDKLTEKARGTSLFNHAVKNWDDYKDKMDAIGNIKEAQKLRDKWNKVNDAYGHFGNANNVVQIAQGAEGFGQELLEATNLENKGVFEASTDLGIAGISILQTGVGIVATGIGYIPGGKAIAGKTILWFNLSTNVWKGNLKYLSKMEKIDRAEEVTEYIPVIIVATDATGLSTRFVVMVPVSGMEI